MAEPEQPDNAKAKAICLLSPGNSSALLSPIESAARIKYTCVATSKHYIALGANTGGVYCFHRQGYRYIRILANQEAQGSVRLLQFSPNESSLAVCCGGGSVGLWELNLTKQGISKRVHVSTVLKDATVTDMIWDSKAMRLFFGDDQGRIAVSYMPKKLFKKPDEVLHQEKPIVQMDLFQNLLLVSTVARCVLLNVVTREVVQVGKRSREGHFGACFNACWPGKPPKVYSARPGGRLWEADIEGTVLSTLRLKELISLPAMPLVGVSFPGPWATAAMPIHPLHFTRLSILGGQYLVCWGPGYLYLFHCETYHLAGWTEALGAEDLVLCDNTHLLVLREGGRAVDILECADVSTTITQLVRLGLAEQARQLMESNCAELIELVLTEGALCRACAEVLTDVSLSHSLLALLQVVCRRLSELDMLEQSDGGVARVEQDGGGVAGMEQDGGGVARVEQDSGGVADMEQGGGGMADMEQDGGDVGILEEDGGVAGEVRGKGGVVEENGGLSESMNGTMAKEDEVAGAVVRSSQEQTMQSPFTGHQDSGHSDGSGQAMIETSVDFPNGPALSDEVGEPDLDNTLTGEAEESVLSLIPEEEDELSSSHTSMHDEKSEEVLDSGTHSQSKAIPRPASNHVHKGMAQTPDSTPSSSVGGSVGQQSWTAESASGAPPRVIPSASVEEDRQDDVVAVSMIVRSSSTGSLGGKSKSKKKTRRKKSASAPAPPPPSQPQLHPPVPAGAQSTSPSSLLYIAEEDDLPFPEAGLPSSLQSSPSTSHNPSPFPSLPSTPPLARTPPKATPPLSYTPPKATQSLQVDSHVELSQRLEPLVPPPAPEHPKPKVTRSSSMDLSAKGGVVSALSKVKPMKVVKGLLSSLSSSHDPGPSQVTSQPVIYRNSDVHQSLPMATPTSLNTTPMAGVVATSPPSSVEQGELPSIGSPLSDSSAGWLSSTSPPPSQGTTSPPPAYVAHPDTTSFSNTTLEARTDIESPAVLCSAQKLNSVLSCWLKSVQDYQSLVSSSTDQTSATPPSLLTPPPPFSPLLDTVCSALTYLVTLCAELGVYSATPPGSEGVAHESCDLEHFIGQYAEVLDWPRVRCLLAREDWVVRKHCWWALLNAGGHYLESPHISLNRSRPSVLSDKEMLSLLLQSPCSSEDFLTLAVTAFPRLMPWEVALACNAVQQSHDPATPSHDLPPSSHDLDNGLHDPALFVAYLHQLLGSQDSAVNKEIVKEVFQSDPALLVLALCAVLVEGVDPKKSDCTSVSRSEGELAEHERCLQCLVDMCVSMEGGLQCKKQALAACQDAGYTEGVVRLLVATGDRTAALKALVALGKVKLLTDSQVWGNLLESKEDWQIILDNMATPPYTTPTDPEQAVDADKSDVGWLQLFMAHFTPTSLRRLLSGQLGQCLHGHDMQSLLLANTALHIQQRGVAHALLEKVDRYLWSPRPSALGPHVHSTHSAEREADVKDVVPPSQPLPLSPLPLRPCLEEVSIHWGVKTSASVCLLCRLPLTSPVSDRSPGVVTFLCGHAFHKICVPELACVHCFTKNLQNIL